MTPLAAKIIGICLIALLFVIWRLLFKNTLKGEAGASSLLFVAIVAPIGMALPTVLTFLFKVVYYMFV